MIADPILRDSEIKLSTGLTRSNPMFEEISAGSEDVESINRLAPVPLKSDQVYVRSMYLCSTQPCLADGCQFTRNALEEIAGRIVGQSVLSGHDRSSLPLARFYKATVVPRGVDEEGQPVYFVRAWFYWMRETSGARDLLLNIDGGIYREVSLAWKYETWRCSTCNSPNGMCGHRVGSVYNGKRCCRLIEHITEVLEGSVVYKSADRNTLLSGVRSLEEECEFESVTLVANASDSLFACLETSGLLEEQRDWVDCAETFTHGLDCLWVRGEEDFIQHCMERCLAGHGAGVGESVRNLSDEGLSVYPHSLDCEELIQPGEVI